MNKKDTLGKIEELFFMKGMHIALDTIKKSSEGDSIATWVFW